MPPTSHQHEVAFNQIDDDDDDGDDDDDNHADGDGDDDDGDYYIMMTFL